jgi:hypothetical protein
MKPSRTIVATHRYMDDGSVMIETETEITTDGKTVWVNDSQGCCIGRFSKHGIDVHHGIETQMEIGKQCLDCKPGPTTLDD